MATQGYDYLTTEPDQLEEWKCKVCNTPTVVTRGLYGPVSWASAIAKSFHHYDVFVCPFADDDWHHQAYRLVVAIEETPSKRIAQLMKQDLDDLLHQYLISV
jgi:hypothetical protein